MSTYKMLGKRYFHIVLDEFSTTFYCVNCHLHLPQVPIQVMVNMNPLLVIDL